MTAFFIAAFLLLLGGLAGRETLWSLAHASPAFLLGGALLFALLGGLTLLRDRLPFARRRTAPRFHRWLAQPAPLEPFFRASTGAIWQGLLLLAGAGLFYALRMRRFAPPPTGLGDSLLLLEHVPVYARLFGYLDSFDELLALFLRSKFYLAGADLFDLPADASYALFSAILGGAYLLVLLHFLRGRTLYAALAGLALFLFSPAVQLYAGYVENYTLAALLLSSLLFTAGRELERAAAAGRPPAEGVLLRLAALAALGVLVHGVVAFVLPGLVYLTYLSAGRNLRRMIRPALRAGGLAGLVIVPVWFYFFFLAANPVDFFESFAYRPALYPPRDWFSAGHLRPLVNLPLLVAPGALLLFWCAPLLRERTRRLRPIDVFFLLATLGFAGHAFVWNPLIGFPADWDLFTFFQAPLHCFVFYRFIADEADEGSAKNDGATPEPTATAATAVAARTIRPALLAGLLFVALATGPFWLARNAADSPESRSNLANARNNVDRFLARLKNDDLLARIENSRRRKKYVKGLLFVLRSREFLRQTESAAARETEGELEQAWRLCRQTMLLAEGDFDREFPAAWQALTRVNIRIEALKTASEPRP